MRARFDITSRCNLNCMHCGATEFKTTEEWTTEEALKVFKDLLSNGFSQFDFLGGEPLIRDDILDICSYLNENKAFTLMATNGLLLNEEIINTLVNLKFFEAVFFSIDGASKEVYETIRGKGTYEKMLSNLGALASKKKEAKSQVRIGLTCVVNKVNASETAALVELADQYDLDCVSLISIGWLGNAKKNKDKLYIEPQQEFMAYDRAARKISSVNRIRAVQGKHRIAFSLDSTPSHWKYYFIQKYSLLYLSSGKYECAAGDETFFVSSPGVLYPCEAVRIHLDSICSDIGEFELMSMPEYTFKEITSNGSFRRTVDYIKDKEQLLKNVTPCSTCPYSDGCCVCPLHARAEETVSWCGEDITRMLSHEIKRR